MKIFKNRGDIYLSKSRTGADREQHILLGILAAVLLVSVVVVVYVGAKNDFSAKKFFCPGPNGSNFPNSRRYHRPAGVTSGQRKNQLFAGAYRQR